VACAALAMREAFTASAVVHTRDLSFFYWPHHLWLRSRLLAGTFPLWDPFVGCGQPAVADPLRQMLFPPTLALRLLPPVLGFNLIVALPVLVAAMGTYLFLRRHASPPAASLGAIVFALSGPVLSTANNPNMGWSLAFAPGALAAVDGLAARASAGRVAVLAVLFALQALAGETVTFAGSAALAVCYAASIAGMDTAGWRERARLAALTAGAWAFGILLAAPQLFPLLRAARLSGRGTEVRPDVLSLHPLALLETVAWPLFGDWYEPWRVNDPWLLGLYGIYASVYLGTAALALALLGALSPGRWRFRLFWCLVALVSLLLALGRFTPVYGAFMTAVPMARSFRYPAKYAIFAALALAALAALGWDGLVGREDRRRRRAVSVAAGWAAAVLLLATLALIVVRARPAETTGSLTRVAEAAGLADAGGGAAYLAAALRAALPRTLATAGLTAAALLAARGRPPARWAVLAVVAADLLMANGRLNPAGDARLFREPSWVAATRAHPEDRTYVGGRLSWVFDHPDPDDPGAQATPPRDAPRALVSSVYAAQFATFPSPWGVREAASANLAMLWPREYTEMLRQLINSGREGRTRFLRRAGVRYFVMPHVPAPEARPLLRLPGFGDTALYEVPGPAPRASMVAAHRVVPGPSAQLRMMFDAGFAPGEQVLLEEEPGPAAGAAGPPHDPLARIETDDTDEVVVRVRAAAGGGFHVLLDSYDAEWEAEVDGRPARVLRANGLFRAVRVTSGEHEVRWAYRPRTMRAGAGVAAGAALVLLAGIFLLKPRARPQ
jgi:hypothetical protein